MSAAAGKAASHHAKNESAPHRVDLRRVALTSKTLLELRGLLAAQRAQARSCMKLRTSRLLPAGIEENTWL